MEESTLEFSEEGNMPAKRKSGSTKRQAIEPEITSSTTIAPLPAGVTAVRLLWTDFAGIRRCRVIPSSRWAGVASGTDTIRLARACAALQTTMDAVTPGVEAVAGVVGDVSLFPVTRPAALPWHPQHAVALCELRKLPEPEEEVLTGRPRAAAAAAAAAPFADEANIQTSDDADALTPESFALCPRSAARRAVMVAGRSNMTLRFGFETEFKLAKRGDASSSSSSSAAAAAAAAPAAFAEPGNYCHSLVLDAHSAVLDEIVACVNQLLENASLSGDVKVEQWHVEAGNGAGANSAAFELVTSHAPLLDAVDALVLTRETICQVARRRGYDAVLLPKPDGESAAGIGCHAHFRSEILVFFFSFDSLLSSLTPSPSSHNRLWIRGQT